MADRDPRRPRYGAHRRGDRGPETAGGAFVDRKSANDQNQDRDEAVPVEVIEAESTVIVKTIEIDED